ncbi:MAG TPA: ROK family protein [Spirochaetota bacterium]|nr:ROK family protein [Spirochaetota bacterium]
MQSVLAFDIGGTFIKAARVSSTGEILQRVRVPVSPSREEMCAILRRVAQDLLGDHEPETTGIGVGAPGAIDRSVPCIAGFSENIPQLVGVSLREVFEGLSDTVLMDNDANAAAWGEHRWGAARGMQDVLVITLGTGIGGGLIINGRPVSGRSGYAGEFGHTIIDVAGRRCTCGGTGCVEAYASAWALRERAADIVKRHPQTVLGQIQERSVEPLDIVQAAQAGDPWAAALIRESGEYLGIAIASAVNLLNPEAVILGGGLSAAGQVLFTPLEESFRLRVLPAAGTVCRILPASLGNDAGLMGAASLVFDEVSA